MQDFERNKIRLYTKIDHIHYCLVAYEAKDIANFIRHFLWLAMDWSGEFYDEQSLRACLVGLTGWDGNVIKNAIARLIKNGEIERINPSHYRWNHSLANRFSYTFYSKYKGNEPKLSPAQETLQTKLKKLLKHTRSLPQNQNEMDELEGTEEQGIENMVALKKIENLEQTVKNQEGMLKDMHSLLLEILSKVEIPNEVQDKVKRHLELVRD